MHKRLNRQLEESKSVRDMAYEQGGKQNAIRPVTKEVKQGKVVYIRTCPTRVSTAIK
jgi:hypothetical protein